MDGVSEALLELADAAWDGSSRSDVEHAITRHIVDTVGCAAAGSKDPSAQIACRIARSRGPGEATLLFHSSKVPVEWAAFANGVMARCLDLNDSYFSVGAGGHPSDYIPAMLAAAEQVSSTGRDLVRAISVCYEAFCRLSDAAALNRTHVDYVVNGSVAVALAIGRLRGLDAGQQAHAISLALVPNVALAETRIGDVSMWKNCASACAARNGIFAVDLAEAGMTGPPAAFAGRSGFINAIAPDFDLSAVRAIPSRPAVLGCSLKRYPAGYFSQSAIDAAIEVAEQIGVPQIRSVTVRTSTYAQQVMASDPEKWHPLNRETADHSIPFLVASALVFGTIDASTFCPSRLSDSRIRSILGRLEVVVDPAFDAVWPAHSPSEVRVVLVDGATVSVIASDYRGHPTNPMDDREITQKFLTNTKAIFSNQEQRHVLAAIWDIAQCDSTHYLSDLLSRSLTES